MTGLIILLALAALGIAALYAIVKVLERKQKVSRGEQAVAQEDGPKAEDAPYAAKVRLITETEARFFTALATSVTGPYVVLTQVPLGSLVTPLQGAKGWQSARNKIDRKTVDFVIVDARSWKPLLVVELNDWSHARASRKQRDLFVQNVFEQAGIRLMTYPATEPFNRAHIREEVMRVIAGPPDTGGQ